MTGITILPVPPDPEHPLLRLASAWHWTMWGSAKGLTPEVQTETLFRRRPALPGIPATYVAVLDGVPAGTGGLWESDCPDVPHLSPWLAGLYVDPAFRGRGVGAHLVRYRLRALRDALVPRAYIWSSERNASYHSRFGWTPLAAVTEGIVMTQSLRPA